MRDGDAELTGHNGVSKSTISQWPICSKAYNSLQAYAVTSLLDNACPWLPLPCNASRFPLMPVVVEDRDHQKGDHTAQA